MVLAPGSCVYSAGEEHGQTGITDIPVCLQSAGATGYVAAGHPVGSWQGREEHL